MSHRIVILSVAVVMLASMACAQTTSYQPTMTRTDRWEWTLQTRYTTSQTIERDYGSKLEFEDDLGWGFGFGYHFNQRFDLGMIFSWRTVDYQATVTDRDDPTRELYYSNELSASTIGLAGDWNILPGKFVPYVSGAIGWTLLDTNIYAGSDWGCYWDPWYGYICYDYSTTWGTDEFTYSLGLGLRVELTPQFFAKVGYEHAWLDGDSYEGADMFRVDIGFLN